MVKKKEKQRMMDYLVGALEGSGPKITPVQNASVNGNKFNCIRVDDSEGLVLLVDRAIGRDKFSLIHRAAGQSARNVASVFYKDGKTFFRSAASPENTQGKTYKATKDLSLKRYNMEDMHNMIELRPEEIMLDEMGQNLQYYQPESERLEEGVVTFRFAPVIYDYSHIPSDRRFGPETREAVRLRLIDGKNVHSGNLKLEQGVLIDRSEEGK